MPVELTYDSIFNIALIKLENHNNTTYEIIRNGANRLYSFTAVSDGQAIRRFWSIILEMQSVIDDDKEKDTLYAELS